MTNVREARIGDIATRATDRVAVEHDAEYQTIGLLNRGRGVFNRPRVRGSETKYSTYYRVRPGQLIFSKLFAWEGSVTVIPDGYENRFVSPEFPTYNLHRDVADQRYIDHVVKWEGFTEKLSSATTGMGQRRQRVNPDKFEAIRIPLPDLPEQRRIATHLDRIADLSAQTSGQWRSPRNALTDMLVRDTPRRPIGSFASQAADAVPVIPSEAYKTVGLMNRGRGCFARPIFTGADTKYRTLFRVAKDQLMFSKLFAWEGSVTVVPESFDGMLVSSEFPTYDLDPDRASPRYVAHLTKWHGLVDELASATTGMGQRRQRVMPAQFEGVHVPFPNLDTQERIADVLDLVTAVEVKMGHRATVASALLPAARNSVFNKISSR